MISIVTNSLAPSSGSDHGAQSISVSAQCWDSVRLQDTFPTVTPISLPGLTFISFPMNTTAFHGGSSLLHHTFREGP